MVAKFERQLLIATQAQLADFFVFYVEQGKKSAALNILDQVLAGNSTTGETLSQSLTHSHCCPGWPQAADAAEVMNVIFRPLHGHG